MKLNYKLDLQTFATQWPGQLKANEIFSSIFNMIISQELYVDNIKGANIAPGIKVVDGTLYGDTKLYYDCDIYKAWPFLHEKNEATTYNLLTIHRPADPKVQAITIDTFQQIPISVDEYLTKRAWKDEGSWGLFNSVILKRMEDTKDIYDFTLTSAYIGTVKSTSTTNEVTVDVTAIMADTTTNGQHKLTLVTQAVMEGIADALDDLTIRDSRAFNANGFVKKFDLSDFELIGKNDVINALNKMGVPFIYHSEKLEITKVHNEFFGAINAGATAGNGTTVRSLRPLLFTKTDNSLRWYRAGELVDIGDTLPAGASYTSENKTGLTKNGTVLKFVHKDAIPFMSAFRVGTAFFNARNLVENHYITWGHNTLVNLDGYPIITLKIIGLS